MTEGHRDSETANQTGRQAYVQSERHSGRQTYRGTERHTYIHSEATKHTGNQTVSHAERHTYKPTYIYADIQAETHKQRHR